MDNISYFSVRPEIVVTMVTEIVKILQVLNHRNYESC